MSAARVLLTGAAGKVGRYIAPQLLASGFKVFSTDLVHCPERFNGLHGLVYIQCDLTNRVAVSNLIKEARPDVVLHTAAVVAPISYTNSELARKVNVDATESLLLSLKQYELKAHFVFCSSYTVHGPCAPGQAEWSGDTPYNPADDYGHQKVASELLVKKYAASWSILRIGGVFDAEAIIPKHPSFRAFSFMVPLGQYEHGVDVQDVVTALVNAARVTPHNKILMLGGDVSWRKTALQIRTDMMQAMGFNPIINAYKTGLSDDGCETWYYENWMNTTESQNILTFQNNNYADFLKKVRAKYWLLRWLGPILRPLVGALLAKDSPYIGKGAITQGGSLWEDVKRVYSLDETALNIRHASEQESTLEG